MTGLTADALALRALATMPGVSIVVFDQAMRIQALYGDAARRHGCVAERMLGRRAPDVLPAGAWEHLGPLYARALAGETVTAEAPSHDGTAVYETTFSPVHEDGAVVGGTAASRELPQRRGDEDRRRGSDLAEGREHERRAVERFERSFTEAPVGMLLLRGRRIERANAAVAALVGLPPESLVGRDPLGFIAEEDLERSARSLDRLSAGHAVPAQERRIVGAGGVLHTRMRYSILSEETDGEPLVLVHVVDRTAEVNATQERERALAQFSASFDAAPIGMCLVAADGRFLKVNDALCRLLARTEDELLRCDFRQLTHPDDLQKDLALLHETLAGERDGYELEKRYLRADGAVIEARLSVALVRDGAGRPVHFVSQIVDLTELERARRELSQATGRLQAILDHSPMAIYMRDLDQRWILTNPETCRIIGRSAEQLHRRPMAETVSPERCAQLAAHDAEVLASGRARSFDEVAPDARTGDTHHWWSLKFPVRDGDGEIIGLGGVSLDVTERERVTRELAAARALFETMFASAPVGELVSRVTGDGTGDDVTEVIQCNPAFARMLGREPEDIVGRSDAIVVHPDDLPERRRMIDAMLAGQPASGELRYKHADGHDVWTLTSPATTFGPDGERLFVLQAVDIGERKRFESRLQHLADHDALTGLFGRRRFEEELAREVARARRCGGTSSLLLLDLDGFKYVNDSFGHSAGDELLTRIARALRETLREGDVLARLGGDEFAVILPDTTLAGGRSAAAKLTAAVRLHGQVTGADRQAEVTASIGLTDITATGEADAEQLLVEADIAMYQAKDGGKDRTAGYDRAGGRQRVTHHTDWIGRLRRAITQDRFVVLAQPIVPLQPAAPGPERHELLLRLRDDDGQLILPGSFLHHAERHGLVTEIDRWVLGEAVRLLHDAHGRGRDLRLAVNLSARTMQDSGVIGHLGALLEAHPVREGSLMIEVTETAAITNLARAAELARQLRALGCRLALDDFGTGFASFFYLKHLVFDVLKIDGAFIEQLPSSATDQLVVRAVVAVARGLGAQVVAEHVTDQATAELLRELGVDFGQGFHLGRPAPLGG